MFKNIFKEVEWKKGGIILIASFMVGSGLYFFKTISEQPNQDIKIEYIEKHINKRVETIKLLQYVDGRIDPAIGLIIAREIDKASKKYFLPPEFIIGLMKKESVFNPLARSKVGAIGLMQILPSAHPEKIKGYSRKQLYHISVNIDIGCRIFKEYYDKTKSVSSALKKYVGGNVKNYMVDIYTTFIELSMYTQTIQR